ncbi:MAG: hypothetical protein CR997_03910 [Acidobacteria bacterium]|nr:MAG: hypothetical protein CR997_03910 [Acidobacteriota bacterium]
MSGLELSNRKVLIFWYPLLLTWLMMAVEGPYLAAIIARLPQEKYNLAAFGVSFALALVIEAPVIMLMSAAIALIKGSQSFKRLSQFTWALNIGVIVLNLLVLIPVIFNWIAMDLLQLEKPIADLVYATSLALLPWAPAIGFRRFYQGLLIQAHQTRKVTAGTVFRLVAMGVSAWALARFSPLPGAVIGGLALSVGVLAEAIATRILVHQVKRDILQTKDPVSIPSYAEIFHFYLPLALTSLIGLSVRPAIVFFMGQSRMALETLAVLPVINSLLFIFSAIGLSFQEVGVALMGEHLQHKRKIHQFAVMLSCMVTLGFLMITFTPMSNLWFEDISGLSTELTEFAILPAKLMILMPWLSVYLSYQRALMVNLKTTKYVSRASAVEVAGIILILLWTIHFLDLIGAIAASFAITGGRILSTGYLQWKGYIHGPRSI